MTIYWVKSLIFKFFKKSNFPLFKNEFIIENNKQYMESEERLDLANADIEVCNMSKKWPNGELAVNNLSFRAYRGQVCIFF